MPKQYHKLMKNGFWSIMQKGNYVYLLFMAAVCFWSASIFLSGGYEMRVNANEAEEKKVIALTFDDGPHPVYTPILLEGLKKRGVKCTFFVTGKNVEAYPQIIKQMQKDGHLIGNHTYSHMQLTNCNLMTFREELIRTNEAITKLTGKEVIFVRPPYGLWDKSLEKDLNMIPVLWTVDPVDWATSDCSSVVGKMVRETKENDIVLLHDCYESSVNAALSYIDMEIQKGFSFVTVEEILFD